MPADKKSAERYEVREMPGGRKWAIDKHLPMMGDGRIPSVRVFVANKVGELSDCYYVPLLQPVNGHRHTDFGLRLVEPLDKDLKPVTDPRITDRLHDLVSAILESESPDPSWQPGYYDKVLRTGLLPKLDGDV